MYDEDYENIRIYKAHYNKVHERPYPLNLFADLKSYSPEIYLPEEITPDIMRGLMIAMSYLEEREADMLKMRYEQCMTYVTIGEKHNLTSNRVQQLISRSLRKLREPYNLKIIQLGLNAYIKDVAQDIAATKDPQLFQKGYKKGYEEGFKDGASSKEENVPSVSAGCMSIDELRLTRRIWLSLKRAGIETVDKLLEYTDCRDLERIRNLGNTGLTEIAQKLDEIGLITEVWKKWL